MTIPSKNHFFSPMPIDLFSHSESTVHTHIAQKLSALILRKESLDLKITTADQTFQRVHEECLELKKRALEIDQFVIETTKKLDSKHENFVRQQQQFELKCQNFCKKIESTFLQNTLSTKSNKKSQSNTINPTLFEIKNELSHSKKILDEFHKSPKNTQFSQNELQEGLETIDSILVNNCFRLLKFIHELELVDLGLSIAYGLSQDIIVKIVSESPMETQPLTEEFLQKILQDFRENPNAVLRILRANNLTIQKHQINNSSTP